MSERTNPTGLFADRIFYKKLWQIGFPITLQSLMLAAVAAGDAIMLGRIAQDSMASVSLASQIQFIQNMILAAVTGAGSILGAQYWGKGDKKTVRDLFHLMLRLSGAVSLLFFIGCVFFPEILMHLFASDPHLIELGSAYLRIAGFSYLLTGFSQCYITVMKVSDHVRPSAFISSFTVLVNIALNAVFIFGLFGLPAMDVRGAALATLLSRVIELLLCLFFSSRKGFIRPTLRGFFSIEALIRSDYQKICLPLLGGALFWGIGFTSYTAIMGHMGSDAAAANSIAAVVRDLICCACNGIASAGGILVGNELGAGNLARGRIYGDRLMKLSFLLGFASMLLALLLAGPVTRMAVMTDEARHYLLQMMIIMAVYMVGRCANTIIINGIFAAGGDTLFDMYSLAVSMWGIAIPLALLSAFVFHLPVALAYACTCLDEVGKIPWVLYHYRKYKWVKDLTR